MACKHLIKNDSYCPNIALIAVIIIVESLQRHINRRTHIVTVGLLQLSILYCESEISYFDCSFVEEYIGRLEVPMKDSVSIDPAIPVYY